MAACCGPAISITPTPIRTTPKITTDEGAEVLIVGAIDDYLPGA
jgi:hypothetical protein